MYYPDEIVEKVRSANNIVDVIGRYVHLTKKGSSYFGLCPFHNEKTPSFSVSEDKQMYYCFGCGKGGNVITFLMEYDNMTFPDALQYLAGRAGIALPERELSGREKREADQRQRILDANREAARYYYAVLHSEKGRTGMAYLREKRSLSDETIRKFGLGYADKYSDSLYRYLTEKGYAVDDLRQSGLFTFDEKRGVSDKFWNRVMFPIMDVNQRVIAFGGRVMGDAKPKYLNSPDTPVFDKSRNLYGLYLARRARTKRFILCEGYMDVIALHQAGFSTAVASLGTSFTEGQAGLLKRYADGVYLVYDSDEAGVRAILRALPILRRYGFEGQVVHLDPYKDPDEFIKNRGKEAFRERLDQAENGFLFQASQAEKRYHLDRPDERTRFQHELASMLLIFDEPLERNNYLETLALRYGMDPEDLKHMVAQAALVGGQRMTEVRPAHRKERRQEVWEAEKEAQKVLMTFLFQYPESFPSISRFLYPTDFSPGVCRQTAEKAFEQAKNGEIRPAAIASCFTEAPEQEEAASLFTADLSQLNERETVRAVREALHKVKESSIRLMDEQIDRGDLAALQKLMDARKSLEDLDKWNPLSDRRENHQNG